MEIGQHSGLIQAQHLALKLNPQMLQSIQLMELPSADLRDKIAEELQKNPALEMLRDNSLVSFDELYKKMKATLRLFNTGSGTGITSRSGGKAESDLHHEFIEGALSRPKTLQEHLLFQLGLESVSHKVSNAGELIIQNLSSDGFNIESPDILLKKFSQNEIISALNLVQKLDPQGCATSNYRESLVVQARLRYGVKVAEEIESILPYLDEFERDKITAITRKTGKNEAQLQELFTKLKRLTPFPGRQYVSGTGNTSDTCFIIPDVVVARKENEFKIIINNEEIPVLGISPVFSKNDKIQNMAERDFIRANIKQAQYFIQALNKRKQTIFRVSQAIVYCQKEFFLRGPKYLRPLTLRHIGEKLKLHETTVSRAANGKYMETEWGIFEIRYFFSNSIHAASPDINFSKAGVKEIIREIILREKHCLSDNEIMSSLQERGITIARRTVAKYRNELSLASSYRR
ncbi:MAG: RNA polymerase factor sigma-54 [Spirochaetaceae bacterium]|jgi:RNA polymerase sigma-54 factor|nr:RNA polymerase factor sigma-54 [Spirochaetaceae bacterium]